jgi:hypothetical protein
MGIVKTIGVIIISWELNLEHPAPGRRVNFPIEASVVSC